MRYSAQAHAFNAQISKDFAELEATGPVLRIERTWTPTGGFHGAGKFAKSSQKTSRALLRLSRSDKGRYKSSDARHCGSEGEMEGCFGS